MGRRRDKADTGSSPAAFGDPGIDFTSGQLTAFTWLGTLGDLDLDLIRVDQIIAGNAKAA